MGCEITNHCSFSPQFSLFGSRSNTRPAAHPPLPPSPSPSVSVTPSPQTFRRAERTPCSGGLSKAEFLERVRRSNQACQEGEFALAVRLYTEALTADPQNCILYSNRSAAYLRLGQYGTALEDAVKARLINPKWPKVRAPNPSGGLFYPPLTVNASDARLFLVGGSSPSRRSCWIFSSGFNLCGCPSEDAVRRPGWRVC